MQNRMWLWVAVSATALVVSGCASRGWVREFVGQKETQIDQRIGKVEGQVTQEGQRITGVENQVSKVETQVGNVEAQVGKVESQVTEQVQRVEGMGFRVVALEKSMADVNETAKGAMAKAEGVDARLTRLWNNRYRRNVVDTVSIPFAFNRAELSDGAQTALLGIARELQANPGLSLQLEGYTDGKGSRDYNYTLSQRRVESVRRFLARQGVELDRMQWVGLGALDDRAIPDSQKRRVTVKLLTDVD
jgi:outer membrane protein OmpA-like peptidoglycan-associated protein